MAAPSAPKRQRRISSASGGGVVALGGHGPLPAPLAVAESKLAPLNHALVEYLAVDNTVVILPLNYASLANFLTGWQTGQIPAGFPRPVKWVLIYLARLVGPNVVDVELRGPSFTVRRQENGPFALQLYLNTVRRDYYGPSLRGVPRGRYLPSTVGSILHSEPHPIQPQPGPIGAEVPIELQHLLNMITSAAVMVDKRTRLAELAQHGIAG